MNRVALEYAADGSARQLALDFSARALAPQWAVRESARARRLSARVFRDGRVEIVVPRGTRASAVQRFVAHSRSWIESAAQRAAQRPAEARQVSDEFPPRSLQLTALGEEWQLELDAVSDRHALRQALRHRLRRRAAEAMQPMLQSLALEVGVEVSGLQIRLQRSRWGSCTRRGTISLNACLLFQEPAVVRYLLIHELAHRRYMNHGTAFWRLVARHEPRWRELDRQLARGFLRVPRWIFHEPVGEQAS